jgi:alanyl-tRNA synthetase
LLREDVKGLVDAVTSMYGETYPELQRNREKVIDEITKESEKFEKTLAQGLRMLESWKAETLSGEDAFILFSTYGFPFELTEELAKEKGIVVETCKSERYRGRKGLF